MTKESLRIYSQAMTEFELLFVSHDCSLVGPVLMQFFFFCKVTTGLIQLHKASACVLRFS